MARLAVRKLRHALLYCSLDAAGFARFVWPSVFLFVYLLLRPVLRLSSDLPSKKERKNLKRLQTINMILNFKMQI